MYQVFVTRSVVKESKKRGKAFQKQVTHILEKLSSSPHPFHSEQLTGELEFVYSYHFNFTGTAFRLAYTIDEKEKRLTFVLLGPRENFYKTLKQKLS